MYNTNILLFLQETISPQNLLLLTTHLHMVPRKVLVHYFHYITGVFITWLLLEICKIIHLYFLPDIVHRWKHPWDSSCHMFIPELPVITTAIQKVTSVNFKQLM